MFTVGQQLVAPEAGWRRVGSDDSGIIFSGSWSTQNHAQSYNGSYRYSTSDNSTLTFTFIGTKLRIIGRRYPSTSHNYTQFAELVVDGEVKVVFSYDGEDQPQTILAEVLNLPLGKHTVQLRVQSGKTGYLNLDAIDIDENGAMSTFKVGQQLSSPETGWRRYEDNVPQIEYIGSWYRNSIYDMVTPVYGDKAKFTFYGTRLRIMVYSQTNRADMTISIDNGTPVTFKGNQGTNARNAIAYEITGLSQGVHTVEIVSLSLNSNTYATIDAIDIDDMGYLLTEVGQSLTTPDPGWKRYNNSDGFFQFVGNWTHRTYSGNYGNDDSYTSTPGSYARFKFIGSKLRLISMYGDTFSQDISAIVDGVEYKFSQYSTNNKQRVITFELLGLNYGLHDVKFVLNSVNGTRVNLDIDAIDIDDTGCVFHPDEVSSLAELQVGKRIRFNYSAPSNVFGLIGGLGKETGTFISRTSNTTPNGDAYFIMVGTDTKGRKILIADRNIQYDIKWSDLNKAGVASGSGLPLKYIRGLEQFYKNIIYVDAVNGDDSTGNGSESRPLKTIQAAVSRASDGDVIFAKAGVYDVTTISGSHGQGGLSDEGKSLTFVGEEGRTIFLCDGSKHTDRDHHAVCTYGDNTTIVNIIFDVRFNGRTTNYTVALFGRDSTTVRARVYNCVFKTDSLCSMVYDNSNSGFVSLNNCVFILTGNMLGSYSGTSTLIKTNCVANYAIYPEGSTNTCLSPALVDSNNFTVFSSGWQNKGTGYNPDGTVANIGVYGGMYGWGYGLSYTTMPISVAVRLLTGGVSSTDKDNEWDKYIVNSTLNGTITAGDDSVWKWSWGSSWTSTTSSYEYRRVIRGGSSVSYFLWGNANTDGYSFRPVLVIEYFGNLPVIDASVDRMMIHSEDVVLTGTISTYLSEPETVQYRILVNGVQEYPASGFTSPAPAPIPLNHTIPNGRLRFGSNTITIEAKNSKGEIGTWSTVVSVVNLAPTITASMTGMRLDMSIDDVEGNAVKYRIELNGVQIYPYSGEYTDFAPVPVSYQRIFRSNEANIGSNNTVKIIAEDSFGARSEVTLNFVGEYAGLMFADEFDNYYSTDTGLVLQLLDMGTLVAGQTSFAFPVKLINKTGFRVTNIVLSSDESLMQSHTNLQFSKTESPFVAEESLLYDDVTLDYDDFLIFYVRVETDPQAPPGTGQFDILVTADPAV